MKNETMQKFAAIAVYYRDIPNSLTCFVQNDKLMNIMKDGVHKVNNHNCPRLTIFMYDRGDNQKRLNALLQLLDELRSNNQIVEYKHTLINQKGA